MKEIKSEAVENYVMNDMVWKVDLPRLLKLLKTKAVMDASLME